MQPKSRISLTCMLRKEKEKNLHKPKMWPSQGYKEGAMHTCAMQALNTLSPLTKSLCL